MGFKVEKRKATLELEGMYAGAEVEVLLDISLGEFTEFLVIDNEATPLTLKDEYTWWEEHVLETWNLEDEDGKPIKIEPGCMTKIPRLLARGIMRAWFDAVTDISDPLDSDSNSGETSLEDLIQIDQEL